MSQPLFSPKRLPDWVAETLASPEPDWLIPGFIPAQGLVLISGKPKRSRKSWLAYLMSMSLASGRHTGPFKPGTAQPVLYCNLEGAPGPTAQRFPMLDAGHGIPLEECRDMHWVHNGGGIFLDNPESVAAICHYILEHRIKLVCFDTFARSFTGDENSSQDVGKAMRGLEKVRDAGAAVMLVTHLNKSKPTLIAGQPDPDASIRGSSAIAGAYDVHLSIQTFGVEDEPLTYLFAGGKYSDWQSYEQRWAFSESAAKLSLQGPAEMPTIESEDDGFR
jgi:RecA-family ATPase